MADTNTLETLPCGCRFGNEDDTFIFIPCSEDCTYYKYVLEEGARQGKPAIVIDAR